MRSFETLFLHRLPSSRSKMEYLISSSVAMMKRTTNSISSTRARQRGNEARGKIERTDSDEPCCYIVNLPYNVIVHIFLQLSIKPLLICKCVCKDWKNLISEPHFAKLHFELSSNTLMIRTYDYNRVSRTLYLLECDPEKFEIGSNNRVRLEPIFKLPLRDAKSFREEKGDSIKNKCKSVINSEKFVLEKKKENTKSLYIACNREHDKFAIVNSCNGLLCLSEPSTGNSLVIYNPVTGEFIRLPGPIMCPSWLNTTLIRMHAYAGLGFHPKINEYKVIRMWTRHVKRANFWVFECVTLEIHTLGTPSWRNVEVDSQISISWLNYPTYVNGAIHWIEFEGSILCFCFESEKLQIFPSPPGMFENRENEIYGYMHISMGEMKGLLYICDSTNFSDITMWVMNEYGIKESWTKVYNITTLANSLANPLQWHYGSCCPIKHFEEGVALLCSSSNCFLYYEPEKYGLKIFQIHGTDSKFFEVISHIPSLISLKDVVKGDNIKVLNVHSRCAKFKLQEENEVISMSQKFV